MNAELELLSFKLDTGFQDYIRCFTSSHQLLLFATFCSYKKGRIFSMTDSTNAAYHHGQLHRPGPALQRGHQSDLRVGLIFILLHLPIEIL